MNDERQIISKSIYKNLEFLIIITRNNYLIDYKKNKNEY